jgi:hypothetical protein
MKFHIFQLCEDGNVWRWRRGSTRARRSASHRLYLMVLTPLKLYRLGSWGGKMLIGKFVSRGVSCAEILIVSMDELVCGDLAYGLSCRLVVTINSSSSTFLSSQRAVQNSGYSWLTSTADQHKLSSRCAPCCPSWPHTSRATTPPLPHFHDQARGRGIMQLRRSHPLSPRFQFDGMRNTNGGRGKLIFENPEREGYIHLRKVGSKERYIQPTTIFFYLTLLTQSWANGRQIKEYFQLIESAIVDH